MYGVWHVPTAATISPMCSLSLILEPLASMLYPLLVFVHVLDAELRELGPQSIEV